MSNYAIIRVRKRSLRAASAMARHALREDHTPNADPAKRAENTVLGPKSAGEVMAKIKAVTDPLAKRKDAVRVVELFVGTSPEWARGKTRQQQDDYFKAALRWVAGKFGGMQNLVSAVIHRDETTPHMQILLTPVVDGKLQANKILGGPAGLSRLQDEFAESVKAHGLRRGEKGSRASHTSIRQFYGALQRVGSVDKLPQKVKVPVVPEKPMIGFFESDADKAARLKAEKARQAALDHNRRVEARLREIAAVGAATHGLGRRRAPKALTELEAKQKELQGQIERAERLNQSALRTLRELPKHLAEEARRRAEIELETRPRLVERVDKPDPSSSTTRRRPAPGRP